MKNKAIVCAALLAAFSFAPSSLWAAEKGDRDQANAMLIGADALLTGGDHAKALEIVKRAIAADASCPGAYLKQGQCQEGLNKPRDAFKSYQLAASLAKKESDSKTAKAAEEASKKLGGGLLQISEADKKLAARMVKIGKEALDAEQLETAKAAYGAALTVDSENSEAKAGLDQAEQELAKRGDPVKTKIANVMLSEVFYYVATGAKADAT